MNTFIPHPNPFSIHPVHPQNNPDEFYLQFLLSVAQLPLSWLTDTSVHAWVSERHCARSEVSGLRCWPVIGWDFISTNHWSEIKVTLLAGDALDRINWPAWNDGAVISLPQLHHCYCHNLSFHRVTAVSQGCFIWGWRRCVRVFSLTSYYIKNRWFDHFNWAFADLVLPRCQILTSKVDPRTVRVNPYTAKLIYVNYHPLKVVSR